MVAALLPFSSNNSMDNQNIVAIDVRPVGIQRQNSVDMTSGGTVMVFEQQSPLRLDPKTSITNINVQLNFSTPKSNYPFTPVNTCCACQRVHCPTCTCATTPTSLKAVPYDFSAPPIPPRTTPTSLTSQDDILSCTKSKLKLSGWYYGELDWRRACEKLKNTKVGTFLIRDSSDKRYKFSLSVQTERGPTSVRIHYYRGKFQLDSEISSYGGMPSFDCVMKLVDHYVCLSDRSKYVWMDRKGETFSHIKLYYPLLHSVPTLGHLCRLTVNRNIVDLSNLSNVIPKSLVSYLQQYSTKN